MAEGTGMLTDFNTAIVPQAVIDQCMDMRQKILDGSYQVMAGPLSDNQGNPLLADGETFTLQDYTDMYFLLDHVIGSLP